MGTWAGPRGQLGPKFYEDMSKFGFQPAGVTIDKTTISMFTGFDVRNEHNSQERWKTSSLEQVLLQTVDLHNAYGICVRPHEREQEENTDLHGEGMLTDNQYMDTKIDVI